MGKHEVADICLLLLATVFDLLGQGIRVIKNGSDAQIVIRGERCTVLSKQNGLLSLTLLSEQMAIPISNG